MYIVFKAFGPHSHSAYYGYTQNENPLEGFLSGATRPYPTRKDVQLLQENHGDTSVIQIEMIDVCEDEMEAWIIRNEQRIVNSDTISGPTMFPGGIAERAMKERPETFEKWKKQTELSSCKTARDAYKLGKWTKDEIVSLGKQFGKQVIVKALDKLSPVDFDSKYYQNLI